MRSADGADGGRARICVSRSPGERRVALLLDDVLTEAWVERPARPDGVGDVLAARVSAVAPAMAGAFLTMPDGSTGFLPESEASASRRPLREVVQEGRLLVVRVTRGAQGGKGPRVSVKRAPAVAATEPGLIERGPDAALRLRQAYPEARLECDDTAEAARLAAAGSGQRDAKAAPVTLTPPAFDDALEAEFDILAGSVIPLPGGGRIILQATHALTALDVDAGPHAGADRAAAEALNATAIREAARQLRLRQCAGAILLDVAGLAARDRASLEPALREALASDRLAECLGVGPLGLFEIRRARIHPPLAEVLAGPLTPGLALLRTGAREASHAPHRRLALHAPAAVLAALRALPEALAEYAAAAGHPITLTEGESGITDA